MTTPEHERTFTPEQEARLRQHLLRLAPPETDLWPAIAPQLAQQTHARRLPRRRLMAVLAAALLLAALLTGAALLRHYLVFDIGTGTATEVAEGDPAPGGTNADGTPYAGMGPAATLAPGGDETVLLPDGLAFDEDGNLVQVETERTRMLDSCQFGQAYADAAARDADSCSGSIRLKGRESDDLALLLACWTLDDAPQRMADALPEGFAFVSGSQELYLLPDQLAQAQLVAVRQEETWAAAIWELPDEVRGQTSALTLRFSGPDGASALLSCQLTAQYDGRLVLEDAAVEALEPDGFLPGFRLVQDGTTTLQICREIAPIPMEAAFGPLWRQAAEAAGGGDSSLLNRMAGFTAGSTAEEARYVQYRVTATGLAEAELDALLDALAG